MPSEQALPLVSIGIPTYNRPRSLEKTIKCFINQSYKNLEIIISDNCSENKKVKQICNKLSKSDNRINYIIQDENIGMYANYQYVLDKAIGKYFLWASDDDLWADNYIETCVKFLENNNNLVLASPLCNVYLNSEEIMIYKPDFDTTNVSKINRIKKIANYIRKSHGAMYGLFRTNILKNIKVKPYIDIDGLILLELSSYGEFKMINKFLVSSYDSTNNEEEESLTFQKKKLIERYNMKPAHFLLKYENFTLFIIFIMKSLKWKTLNFIEHFKVIIILYRSFFGYNRFKLLSIIKTSIFYFSNKKIVGHISLSNNKINNLKKLITDVVDECEFIIISNSIRNNNYEVEINSLLENYNEKILLVNGDWTTTQAESQHILEYTKAKLSKITHCLIIDHLSDFQKISHVLKKFKTYKYFNRAITHNNKLLFFPVRNYISFKTNFTLNVNSVEIE